MDIDRHPQIFYTADLVIPDGTDTSADGDGCEPGYGYRSESGWLSPDWSMSTVFEDKDEARADRFAPDPDFIEPEDLFVVYWAIERLLHYERLSVVETDGIRIDPEGSTTMYGRHEHTVDPNEFGDVRVSMAAHLEGFTPDELREIVEIIGIRQRVSDPRWNVGLSFTGDYTADRSERPGLRYGEMWTVRFEGHLVGSAGTQLDAWRLVRDRAEERRRTLDREIADISGEIGGNPWQTTH